LLNVAIEHRLMHVETLSYMLHQLPLDRKIKRASSPSLVRPQVDHRMVEVPAGPVTLGLPRDGDQFGWDNEFEAHTIQVPGFSIDRYKVTNRQFAEFIAADGYNDRALWDEEDWAWKEAQVIAHPVFWKPDGDQWIYRAMFNEIPLPLDWPVFVSHAEASAYVRWAGKALPTEAEWQRAAESDFKWRNKFSSSKKSRTPKSDASTKNMRISTLAALESLRWDPVPVNASAENQSAFGVRDMFGNGWEWTSTVFAPFPGFEPFPFYRGYSADFFDGKHFVMKGGSPLTAACMLRPTFRNWFQPHYQYVYAGFRCVSH
jgi:iron(II)-dependent oxidoreductase